MICPDALQFTEVSENQLVHRRGVLATLGLAGLGMLASSTTADAASHGKGMGSSPKVSVLTSSRQDGSSSGGQVNILSDLPEEWSERYGRLAPEYLRYLNSLNMQRVCPTQVIGSHAKAKGGVWNALPPKTWWKRMGYVLRVVDRIAREMNVAEVEIISAYRCPPYNALCAGARAGSWHQANVAVDVKFPVRASKVTATARQLRDLGLFRGGVGGYWNFTHIDARGQNINW